MSPPDTKMAVPFRYDRHNKYHRLGRMALVIIASLTIFIESWWIISIVANTSTIPSPAETWSALIEVIRHGDPMTNMTMGEYITSSMETFLKGFLLALAVATPLGLLLGRYKVLDDFATPVIEVLRPIAPIAWAPIFIISVGYELGPMLVVFVGIFFPLLTNVIFGVKNIDPSLTDAARTLGASDMQIFSKVLVPSTIPYLMNGIRVGLGVGWMCIVAAELYASPLGGIGFYLAEQAAAGYWPGAYAAVVVIAILGLLTTGLADYIYRIIKNRMGVGI